MSNSVDMFLDQSDKIYFSFDLADYIENVGLNSVYKVFSATFCYFLTRSECSLLESNPLNSDTVYCLCMLRDDCHV